MCGLCGAVGFPPSALDRALPALAHRGPDGESRWNDDACQLGFRRLAILDLAGGMQPFVSEDGSLRLILNGEIYNHRELRGELEGKGHRFRSSCDAEAALHLFEEHGVDSLARLRGMFSLAVWDSAARTLYLARDRFGKKPLVYAHDGERFAFASEIRALLEIPGIGRELDPDALAAYLARGVVPAPWTMIRQVRKLPPGHYAVFHEGDLSVEPWRPRLPGVKPVPMDEAADRVRSAVSDAVRARLESDAPLGAFLSGGVDSAVVVGVMSRAMKEPVRTFTIGFDEAGFDESPAARETAARFGTRHSEFRVRPDASALLPKIVRHHGEPFADASALPTFELARVTAEHVKVALSGDGGDENFGGYNRYRAIRLLDRLKCLPAPLRWAARLAPVDRRYRLRTRALLDRIGDPLDALYEEMIAPIDASTRARLLPGEGPSAFFLLEDPVAAAARHDLANYLPDDLLVKTDIASMAHGLEVRCPFLDGAVVELAQSLPGDLRIRGRMHKAVLRRAFRDLLPPEAAARPKQGFGIPLDAWLRGPWKALRDGHLGPDALLRAHLAGGEVDRLVAEHDRGADHGRALWTLIVFEEWLRQGFCR